jgi:hypothetical protein
MHFRQLLEGRHVQGCALQAMLSLNHTMVDWSEVAVPAQWKQQFHVTPGRGGGAAIQWQAIHGFLSLGESIARG